MNFLDRIYQFLVFFLSLLSPFEGQKLPIKVAPGTRWFLHIVIMALILVGLYFLNDYLEIRYLVGDAAWARPFFLPIVFILLYALAVTGWWIYRLLTAESEGTDFPDIDEAWEEALDALDQAGIAITEVPVFLVLGRPETPEELLFQAAQLNLIVKGAPIGPRHPLHVYANRDGIFITCTGCSLLGKQASLFALEGIAEDGGFTNDAPIPGLPDVDDGTLKPGQAERRIISNIARMIGTPINGLQKRMLRRETNLAMPSIKSAEAEEMTERMAHLCRLIIRDRQPFCSINGILVLVSLGATDTDKDAQQAAEMCHRDLSVVRRILKVQCPTFAMVVDLEQLAGFREFIHRRNSADRARRIGQRFPLNSPDLHKERLHEALNDSVQWLGNNLIRDLVYKVFKTEPDTKVDANHQLFLILDEWRERKEHLARFITQGIARDVDGPLLFGGCYLAATGSERDKDQAFIRGVMARLFENQDYVSWTEQAFIDDANCHYVALTGYVILGLVVAALGGAFGYLLWQRPR